MFIHSFAIYRKPELLTSQIWVEMRLSNNKMISFICDTEEHAEIGHFGLTLFSELNADRYPKPDAPYVYDLWESINREAVPVILEYQPEDSVLFVTHRDQSMDTFILSEKDKEAIYRACCVIGRNLMGSM